MIMAAPLIGAGTIHTHCLLNSFRNHVKLIHGNEIHDCGKVCELRQVL